MRNNTGKLKKSAVKKAVRKASKERHEKEAKIFYAHVPIFGMGVICVFDCTAKDASHYCYEFKGLESKVEFTEGTNGGVRIFESDVFMWINDSKSSCTVYHELVHVAFCICEVKGIEQDEELIAYLMGWLKTEVADVLFCNGCQNE